MAFVERRTCEMCGSEFYAPPVQVRRGGGRFCSNECRGKDVALHPDQYPQTSGRRGNGGRRSDLDDRYFRSAWEANWARYLNWLIDQGQVKTWCFESETFEFPVKRGSKFYTPDFKVINADDSVEYHEVKGYMDQPSRTKLERMARYYPTVRVIVIDKATYYDVAHKIGKSLDGWETVRNQPARRY